MTTKGVILEQSPPLTTHVDPDGGGANPSLTPETAASGTAARLAKGTHEADEALKAAKKAQEMAKVAKEVKAAREARAAQEAAGAGEAGAVSRKTEKDTTIKKRKPGPCDHLRQGGGKGPYRGGAHGKVSKPANDVKDSHHMPADDISPLSRDNGPAIQMDPLDHGKTQSNGQGGNAARRYRKMLEQLIKDGKWRNAMAKEIKDIRRLSRELGEPKKYNEALSELLAYFKCLDKHGLLK